MKTRMSILKRIAGFVLIGALLFPLAASIGCASKTSRKSDSVFALPTWKDESKPKRPPKHPDTPVTMGEAMQLQRNDVL